MNEWTIHSLEELEQLALELKSLLVPSLDRATLLTLSGDLGAGKTAFTKLLARAYGVSEVVTSPTFVLERRYTLPKDSVFCTLVHIDAYRLDGGEELLRIGWAVTSSTPTNLIVLEWPEHVSDALPEQCARLQFETLTETSRKVILK